MRLLPFFFLLACDGKDADSQPVGDDSGAALVDLDGDGATSDVDCDDSDPYTYPGADEVPYDGRDQDCSGADLLDADGDGHDGEVVGGDDCMDSNPEVHPGHEEVCYNGLDDDCSGNEDTYDCDEDGYELEDDCDDENPDINPGEPDAWYDGVDSDCDGSNDFDQDHDGFEAEGYNDGDDCVDTDPTVNPEADEIWDERDNDCDGRDDFLNTRRATASAYGLYDNDELWFGHDLALVDDLDGDGRKDLWVGSPLTGKQNGRAYLLASADGAINPLADAIGWVDGTGSEALGLGMTVVRGTDGTELLVAGGIGSGSIGALQSAYGWTTDALRGAAGSATMTVEVETSGNAGQLHRWRHADGREFLLTATDFYTGSTQSLDLFDADDLLAGVGDAPYATLSSDWVAGGAGPAPDLDGDGGDEVVVAYAGFANTNAAVVSSSDILEGQLLALADHPGVDTLSSTLVSVAGGVDWQGDGYQDLLLADWAGGGTVAGGGVIYVIDGADAFSGEDAADVAFATIEGDTEGAMIRPARAMGDLDRDGSTDLVLSGPGQAKGDLLGEVRFVTGDQVGAGGALVAAAGIPTFIAVTEDDQYGWVALPDDADGDGDTDLFVTLLGGYGAALYFEHE